MKILRSLPLRMLLVTFVFFSLTTFAQTANVATRVTQPVDVENLVTLRGNTHPLARPEYDQGAAPDSLPMERMLLVLQRSAEQEAALRKLLDEQQMKSSPNYHMWLTPEQFGQQFGPADADIQAVTDWLSSQGFRVGHVAAGRTVIEFSGTAGQVRQAFHTEIHKFVVNGEEHWANASDPKIPAALAPVVAGFASLNNFPKRPMVRRLGTFSKSKATGVVRPLFTYPYEGENVLAVGPTDFATIYNVLPLWSGGTNGSGVTIAVVEQSDINPQDVADFRTIFGLPTSGNYLQTIYDGPDPGILYTTGDEGEATLDAQWAGAVAKGATVDLVVSESTETTAGIDLSALYIVDNNLAPILSESYGACEAYLGNSGNTFYSTIWEQGAAQGMTILIAAGDNGSAGCDDYAMTGYPAAIYGLEVDGTASTPFNVAVGGTDFNDSSNPSLYWNTTNTAVSNVSAKSYIPETTWNDSCANTGSLTGCASWDGSSDTGLTAGSGGESSCVTQSSTACTGSYAKPSWQNITGVPNDGVRDTPDVSLFASNGYNKSFYVYCEMDANSAAGSATSCDLNAPYLDFQGAGGTSFATPAFAGIMAMVNQKYGRQGNANYVLYPLAAPAGASCASTSFMAPTASASSCIFYDVQVGNNSVACEATSLNCGNQTSGYGILVYTSSTTTVPAWLTTAGYDLATGIGTVNAYNLVQNWKSNFVGTATTLSLSPTTLTHGQSVSITGGVTPTSATGDVSLVAQAGSSPSNSTGIGPFTLSSGTFSGSTILLPGGTYGVRAHYAGNGTYGASDSTPVTVTVSPESSRTRVLVFAYTPDCSGNYAPVTTVPYGNEILCSGVYYPQAYWLRMDVENSSGNVCYNTSPSNPTGLLTYQCPAGQVTLTDNGLPPIDLGAPTGTTPGAYKLNSQGHAEDNFIQLSGGTNTLVASYSPIPAPPNNSYNSSQGTATITVTPAPTTITVTASATTVEAGQPVTLTALVSTTSWGIAPTGAVQFLNSGVPITGAVTYTPVNASAGGYASLTGTLTTSFLSNASITAQYVADSNYSASSTASATTITVTAAPVVSLSSTALTFPAQEVGTTSSAQKVTLSNSGSATLSIYSITASGDFAQTNNCGSSLTQGTTCSISVTFTPTAAGLRSGTLTTTDNAFNSPQTVSLTGTGTAPEAGVSPRSLTFGNQNLATTSASRPVTLSNTGNAALTITSIAASANFGETNNCGGSVATSGSCTINVTFSPTATGPLTGTLTITDNSNGVAGSTQTVSLTGTGTGTAVSLSATSLSFGAQLMGSSSLKTVTLRNLASVPLSISGLSVVSIAPVSLTAAEAGDFTIQSSSCVVGGSVAGLGSCTIDVAFKPTAAGIRSATLVIVDSDPSSPQAVNLRGTGSAVLLSAKSLNFGPQPVETTSAPETVTLTNLGNTPLRIESLTLGGTDAGDFAIQSGSTCGAGSTVAGEGNCTINLAFKPSAAGARSAALVISDSDPGSPQTVSLSGTGM